MCCPASQAMWVRMRRVWCCRKRRTNPMSTCCAWTSVPMLRSFWAQGNACLLARLPPDLLSKALKSLVGSARPPVQSNGYGSIRGRWNRVTKSSGRIYGVMRLASKRLLPRLALPAFAALASLRPSLRCTLRVSSIRMASLMAHLRAGAPG